MKQTVFLAWYLALGVTIATPGTARTVCAPHRSVAHGRSRKLLMQRTAADEWEASSRQEIFDDEAAEIESANEGPHPLRTADWKLEMRSGPCKRREQGVTFHRNGTVSGSDGDKGEWWFDVGGLYWDTNTTFRGSPTVLHHKAELHWNVFGSQPRMFRGTVTRDRLPTSLLPPWLFRPVVHSFIGSGVGNDTADTSYRHRQVGMPSESERRLSPRADRY